MTMHRISNTHQRIEEDSFSESVAIVQTCDGELPKHHPAIMEQLVLFRQRVDALDDSEFHQFLCEIGRNLLTSVLFKGFLKELLDSNEMDLQSANKAIDKIFENGDMEHEEYDADVDLIQLETFEFNDIHSALLANISSYLSFTDKMQFALCNRASLIALKSVKIPTYRMSESVFLKFVKHTQKSQNFILPHMIKLNECNSLKMDCLDIAPWNDEMEEIHLLYELNHLKLFDHIIELEMQYEDNFDIQCILDHLSLSLSNVQLVRIRQKAKTTEEFLGSKIGILRLLPNLRFVEISHKIMDPDLKDVGDFAFMSALKGIAINNSNYRSIPNISHPICESLSKDLESLHASNSLISENMIAKFDGLKEICLPWYISGDRMDFLLSLKMDTLERLHFREVGNGRYSQSKQRLLMDNIIGNVEYICFDMKGHGASASYAVDVLMKSLETTTTKTKLKIRINGLRPGFEGICASLVGKLDFVCSDWMLIVTDSVGLCSKSIRLMLNEYVVRNDDQWRNFVISNKNCKINGYKERWIMDCQCCEQQAVFADT